ncbi:MAG: hypothetical protein KFH87_09525 [Bacteroidetes bacterium]|nr:hypothetical protein [Bacteroidota bacterium]
MRHSLKLFVTTALVVFLLPACGKDQRPEQDEPAQQHVNIPLAEEQNGIQPVRVPDDVLPDLSGISDVEAQLFKRTIALQIPYYEALVTWADNANTVTEGSAAAISLRRYLTLQDEFAHSMERLDIEFAGKLDPEYVGSPAFENVVDEYMSNPELLRQTKYIIESYTGLIERFHDDPACQDVFAEIEQMSAAAQ